jgi:hypothetical protein
MRLLLVSMAAVSERGVRTDLRQMLLRLEGKVITIATLDRLIMYTRIREFVFVLSPE